MSASDKKKLRKEQKAVLLTEKQLKEKSEAKKLKNYTVGFFAVIALVLVVAIATAGITAYSSSGIPQRNTNALTVGEHTLTAAELGYFYNDAVSAEFMELYNQYPDNTAMYAMLLKGLDTSLPLDKQMYDEERTFADYYTDLAVKNAISAYTFYDLAVEAGHTLTEAEETILKSNINAAGLYAELSGLKNATQYLQQLYGKWADEESYAEYKNIQALASSYQQKYLDSLDYTQDEMAAYGEAHYNDFSLFSYNIFLFKYDNFIECSASADDKEHVHTEDEIAKALTAAQAAAQAVLDSKVNTVPALDKEISKVPGYETKKSSAFDEQAYASIPEVFQEWVSDTGRKDGDLTVLPRVITETAEDGTETSKTDGYYVVLFKTREDNNMHLVNVRHILAEFEGGTTDPTTGTVTYTEAQKAAAKEAIEDIKKEWESGAATEDSFAALATEKTDDTGSAEAGGLYEQVYPTQMVEAFNDWCFADGRKTGDCEIVETEYGYHLIYFVGEDEITFREYMAAQTMTSNDYTKWYDEIIAKATHSVLDVKKLDRDMIIGGLS